MRNKDIEDKLSYITIIDITTIMNNYKKDNRLYDVQFSTVAANIQLFVKSVFHNGYWDKETQHTLRKTK